MSDWLVGPSHLTSQDYEKLRTGKVTTTQFRAVLDKLAAVPQLGVRPQIFETLVQAFGQRGTCNYTDFCERVEWDMHAANGAGR